MSTVDLPKPLLQVGRCDFGGASRTAKCTRAGGWGQELEDFSVLGWWFDGMFDGFRFFFATKNMGVDCKNRGKLGLDVGIQKNRQGLMDTSKVLLMPNWSKFDEMFEKVSSRWWFLFHYIPLPKKQVKFQDLIELFVCIRLNSESSLHRIVGLGYNTTIHVHLETGAEFRLTIYNILIYFMIINIIIPLCVCVQFLFFFNTFWLLSIRFIFFGFAGLLNRTFSKNRPNRPLGLRRCTHPWSDF